MACHRVLFAVILSTAFGLGGPSKASISGPLEGIVLVPARELVSLHLERSIGSVCAERPAIQARFSASAANEAPAIVPNPFLAARPPAPAGAYPIGLLDGHLFHVPRLQALRTCFQSLTARPLIRAGLATSFCEWPA